MQNPIAKGVVDNIVRVFQHKTETGLSFALWKSEQENLKVSLGAVYGHGMGTARVSAPPQSLYGKLPSWTGQDCVGRPAARMPWSCSMPLLALEPSLFPETLLDAPVAEFGAAEQWWVLHTRPRAEKTLARQCVGRELPFFLPLYHKKWRSGGRTQNSYLPLFPGYVFLYGDAEVRQAALHTNLIASVIPVTDQEQLHADLVRVHRLIDAGSSLIPEDRLQPGSPVTVTSGPLAGLEGKVLRREKNLRFFVEVRLLQQGVSVELESWMIEPVG